jgi:hypothetical protein
MGVRALRRHFGQKNAAISDGNNSATKDDGTSATCVQKPTTPSWPRLRQDVGPQQIDPMSGRPQRSSRYDAGKCQFGQRYQAANGQIVTTPEKRRRQSSFGLCIRAFRQIKS